MSMTVASSIDFSSAASSRCPHPALKRISLPTGVTLPYAESGAPDGVPVIFLHGVIDSWRSFATVLPCLPGSIRALALTQRGHGEAARPAAYRIGDFAADVAAFIDALGLGAAVLVGHSMGATVAQRVAIDYPERTRGLVLIGSFASFSDNPGLIDFHQSTIANLSDPIYPAIVREFQESTLAAPIATEFLELMIAEGMKPPAPVWRAAFAGMLADEHVARLTTISAPTLLLWGERDVFVPRSDQDRLRAAIAGARLAVYRGVGHAVHWEKPARVSADIAALVARC
jgi:non-heme chloroperoxidase